MFGKQFVNNLITRSAENDVDRRRFLKAAGIGGLGVVGASVVGPSALASASTSDSAVSDSAVLNFALNLEYLEAQFYSYAYYGHGLNRSLLGGRGSQGAVRGGHKVPFQNDAQRQYAREIAEDERNHVAFLRSALGNSAVAMPWIDLQWSFTNAAMAAGLIKYGQTFDPFASYESFLLGAFIFEDVGVTAYKGAAPLITNKTYLEAAAGILAVEAYHASTVRTQILNAGLQYKADKISDARDSLDGPTDDDQGPMLKGRINIVPADSNSIAYSRSTGQVLNVVYLTPKATNKGGFFPNGVNGSIRKSADNSGGSDS